ncbi:putative DNA-directed RNA polymerase alpha subunit [Babesia bovis T2Bo]|uniref:DNA-directed RNA polymerase, alpha subunit, putative n=1 Tax=Babesia bovis TaxID=5865 RepID=A7AV73_BABBO|nr:putative DNA-directed RNA polymerase alpha subunit [Babesia bovis T2Bo]EDO05699.1 putative DNA-directed RNA polymerase alpha subunit [Babesia bovis T2Bo]|eukprot:XP_001609267.1 DNA-directed RNA polymerase, alpha subunit [Babesia bovis T2Bo]
MKNVTVVYVCFVIIYVATLAANARRRRQSSHYLGSSVSSSRLSFVKTFDVYVYYLNDGYGNCGVVNKAVSPQPGQMSLKALNPENAELHPETLSHVESTISKEREAELRRLGIIEGDSNTWRNWHIMTQGQWPDIGQQKQPPSDPDAPITELYALRKPLEYWGFMRGIDDNISSYPIMWEYYKDTYGKVDVAEHGGSNPLYSPMLYRPSWDIEKDRGGLGYNDARLFRGWVGLDLDLPTKVKTASDLIMIPDTGRLYQKFYMGPYPITMGWTLGSLLKVLALSRSPGHGVVAVKVHNMNEDTTIDGVTDDLMNIALNLNEVALETLEPGGEARVRTVIKGPAQVCAGSIEWPSFVKIATPDAYITNVEEGGTLDIEIKIEWGRGLWLADYKGLYRHEDAADAVCMRRRRIKEVDEEDFHPITTFFGGCRMVRLAVHKLIGERWDLITSSCPDPREQLVVEVWTDRSTTPKAALEFGLSESIAWIRELKRQLIQDADFDGEDEQLRDTWEKIDKYKSLQQRQQMMGGPPTYNLHDTNAIPGLKESDCQYVGSVDDVKLVPQAPYSLPQIPPPRPQQDSLAWLATELQSEDYDDASPINSRSFEKFLPQPKDRATDVDLSILPVSQEVISSLRLCGFNTVHDIIQITENKLEDYPGISSKDAKIILDFIDSNILMKTG